MANISEQQMLAALREATTNSQIAIRMVNAIDNANIIRKIFTPGVFDTSSDGSLWGFKITNSGMDLYVSLTGTPTQGNYSEAVADGYYVKVEDSYSLPFFTLADGDPDNPRIDCVYIKRPDRIAVSQGTPAATPVAADVPSDALKIAEILVPAGETDGSGITITDKRVFIGQMVTQADLDGKADKTIPASDGNLAALDGATGNLVDSGKQPSDFANATHTHLVADITDFDPATKADKVSGAAAGNLAGLDSSGNLTDSGKSPSDFEVAGAVSNHETTYDHSQLHTHSNKELLDNLTDSGSGNNFLADDGTYKAVSGGGGDLTIVRAAQTNNIAIDTSDVAIPFDTEIYDANGEFDPTTGIFTSAGAKKLDIIIDFSIFNTSGADRYVYVKFFKNGAQDTTNDYTIRVDNYSLQVFPTVRAVIDVVAGDTVQIKVAGSSTGCNICYTSAEKTFLTIKEIG